MSRPLVREEGSGAGILRGTGVLEEQNTPPSTARAWEVEYGSWRVERELLKQSKVYGLESNSESREVQHPRRLVFVRNSATLAPGAAEHLDRITKERRSWATKATTSSPLTPPTAALPATNSPPIGIFVLRDPPTVLRYFIDKHRFNPKKLAAMGFADQRPLFDNNDDVNRGKNTRVEFILSRRPRAVSEYEQIVSSPLGAPTEEAHNSNGWPPWIWSK